MGNMKSIILTMTGPILLTMSVDPNDNCIYYKDINDYVEYKHSSCKISDISLYYSRSKNLPIVNKDV
jgi:hypothetical protein